MVLDSDLPRLRRALDLAECAIGLSEPNPRVGCVIGHQDDATLGEGHTQAAGLAHAEAMALRDALRHGASALRGATAWVTLEPCSHHGRTPPCADALVAAGIGRVVTPLIDPNPAVSGRGLERLRAAGVEVCVLNGDDGPEARAIVDRAIDLNVGFLTRQRRGRPWVRAKMAASLDGFTALPDGRSQWITGAQARADGHAWRARAGAILTGIGTVLADNPHLDTRLYPVAHAPRRIVLDPRARLPADARLFGSGGPVTVYMAEGTQTPAAWLRLGAAAPTVSTLPMAREGQGLDLGHLLVALGEQSVNELHVEAGPKLTGSLQAGGWIDEWLIYLAPRLLGRGRPMFESQGATQLPEHPEWRVHDQRLFGEDLRVLLRRRLASG